MKKALLITDMQYDFLPGGALAVPDGHTLLPDITHHAKTTEYDAIVFSQDWHPADHISFADRPLYEDKSWPPHCVQGTRGAELHYEISELRTWAENVGIPVATVVKGQLAEHEAYSPFDAQAEVIVDDRPMPGTLEDWLKSHQITHVDDVGLATDYCVMNGAKDAALAGFSTRVPLGLTLPVTVQTGLRAVAEMAEHGVSFG